MNVSIKFSGVFKQQSAPFGEAKSFHLLNEGYWVTNDKDGKDLDTFNKLTQSKKHAEQEVDLKLSQNKLNQSKHEEEKKSIFSEYTKGLVKLAQKAKIS